MLLLPLLFSLVLCAPWRGVNLAGLDFGGHSLPGTYNKDYISPTTQEIDYFLQKGFTVFRLPFLWERLQPNLNGPLDATYLQYITSLVSYATSKGSKVLLDPHNYARYRGVVIGDGVPVSAFSDLWTKLANLFKNNELVLFGLMNEPHSMKTETWLDDANAAISAIRSTGAKNMVIVPGNGWTGAHSWNSNYYGTPNAQVMKNIKDSNFAIDVHQYLDSDSSGTSENCVSGTIGSERMKLFTSWAKENKIKAFLGEWGGGRNQVCYSAISDLVAYLDDNSDVYIGWTWWAAGPWWGDYIFALDPVGGVDRPQMKLLVDKSSERKEEDETGQQGAPSVGLTVGIVVIGCVVVLQFVVIGVLMYFLRARRNEIA